MSRLRRTLSTYAVLAALASCHAEPDSIGTDRRAGRGEESPAEDGGQPTPPPSVPVGRVEASFDVNPAGAATYAVPIKVPPGLRGIEPRLSLSYNSQGGMGPAGVGFAIAGLSSIERCPKTVAHDGEPGTVLMNDQDRFCLDRMRLVAISGKYGASGTAYFTEGQTWTRLVSDGECRMNTLLEGGAIADFSGPCSFKGTLKNGVVVEYGGHEESGSCSVLFGGNPERDPRTSWPLTKVTDTNGNSMSIFYEELGQHYCAPSQILYTSNEQAGAPATRKVDFIYTQVAQAPQWFEFFGGLRKELGTRLLTQIRTSVRELPAPGWTLVKSYELAYLDLAQRRQKRIATIKECDGAHQCFQPTLFTWSDRPSGWLPNLAQYFQSENPQFDNMVPSLGGTQLLSGDFNADGGADFLTTGPVSTQLLTDPLNPGTLLRPARSAWVGAPSPPNYENWGTRFVSGDVNADGYTDVVHLKHASLDGATGWDLYLGGPNGLSTTPSSSGSEPSLHHAVLLGDVDGDGRGDLIAHHNLDLPGNPVFHGFRVYLSTGSDFVHRSTHEFPSIPTMLDEPWRMDLRKRFPVRYTLGDFNGDGRIDVLARAPQRTANSQSYNDTENVHTGVRLFESTGTDFVERYTKIWPHASYDLTPLDINGDGLTDLIATGDEMPDQEDVPSNNQEGYVTLLSTGRTLIPILNSSQSHSIHVQLLTPYTMTWGQTGTSVDWKDRITAGNVNDDGRADIIAHFDDAEVDEIFRYDGVKGFVSDGGELFLQGSVPRTWDDPVLVAPLSVAGLSCVYDLWHGGSGYKTYSFHWDALKTGLVTNIRDGLRGRFAIEYEAMTSGPSTYLREQSSSGWPIRDYISNQPLVKKVEKSTGFGDPLRASYHYAGARTDLSGRGFLGFRQVTMYTYDDARLVSTYRLDHPYAGLVDVQETFVGPTLSQKISRTQFLYTDVAHPSWSGHPLHNVRVQYQTTTEYGKDASSNPSELTRGRLFEYDDFGNPTKIIDHSDVTDPSTRLTTEMKYSNDTSGWRIGFPDEVTVYHVDPKLPFSRQQYLYEPGTMNVTFEGKWDDEHQSWLGSTQHYDARGLVERSVGPLGTTELAYDGHGHLERTTNPLGQITHRVVDPRFGNEVQRTDANGQLTIIETDGFGRTIEVSGPDGTGNFEAIRRFVYTEMPRTIGDGLIVQTFTLRELNQSEWDWKEDWFDVQNRKVRERKRGHSGAAIVTDTEYEGTRRVARSTRPRLEGGPQLWIENVYDLKERVVSTKLPDGRSIETEYVDWDPSTRSTIARRTDPNQAVTEFHVDARGKLVEKIDAVGAVTSYAYDQAGRLKQAISPDGQTDISYDSVGRKIAVVDTDTGMTTWTYDANGQLVEELDARGQRLVREYDALGRTTVKSMFETGAATPIQSFTYGYDDPAVTNGIGQLTSVTSSRFSYQFAYDPYGRQSEAALSIDGRTFHWATRYDPAGDPIERTYPDGSIARYSSSSAKFLTKVELWEPTAPPGQFEVIAEYSGYDAEARPGLITYGNDVVTCYEYEPLGRRLQATVTSRFVNAPQNPCSPGSIEGETELLDLSYEWDDVDNITTIHDHLTGIGSQTFEYSPRGELTLASGAYGVHEFGYHPSGNFAWIDRGNGPLTYQYAGGHRATGRSDGLVATYDANGNMSSKVHGSSQWSFDWDVEDQLRSVARDGVVTSFDYDHAGHRLVKEELGPNGSVTYYASNDYEISISSSGERHTKYLEGPSGRIAQVTRTGVTLVSTWSPGLHGRLAGMYDPGSVLGLLRIIRHRTLAVLDGPEARRTLAELGVAASALLLLGFMVWLFRSRGEPTFRKRHTIFTFAAPVTVFVFFVTYGSGWATAGMNPGAHGPGVPETGVRYLHQDQIGSTMLVTDEVGSVSARVHYEPYGKVHGSSSGVDDFRPKFGGHELDASSGLHFMNARYYDAELGRFISADRTAGANPLGALTHNRYAYAANNPVALHDPSGRWATVAIVAALIIGAVVGALIAGTEGKILSDPGHAFDDWSWVRAVYGAWIGMAVVMVTMFVSVLAVAVVGPTIFGMSTQAMVTSSMVAGALSAATDYAKGERDPAALFASFGKGFAIAFVTQVASAAVSGVEGLEVVDDLVGGLANSALKKAENPNDPLTIYIWAFTISIDNTGKARFGVDYGFLASEVLAYGGRLISGGGKLDANETSWDSLVKKALNPKDQGVVSWLNTNFDNTTRYGFASIYDMAKEIGKRAIVYGVSKATGGSGSTTGALPGYVNDGIDGAFERIDEWLDIGEDDPLAAWF